MLYPFSLYLWLWFPLYFFVVYLNCYSLALWEYGGIYSDIDAAPGKLFNATTIKPADDAWFIPEKLGILSQYFMSSSKKHPLLYTTIIQSIQRLLALPNIMEQEVPKVTGPAALREGMITFLQYRPSKDTQAQFYANEVPAGLYTGMDNRTVTVQGSKETTHDWIQRSTMSAIDKRNGYEKMGQSHFQFAKGRTPKHERESKSRACLEYMYYSQKSNGIKSMSAVGDHQRIDLSPPPKLPNN